MNINVDIKVNIPSLQNSDRFNQAIADCIQKLTLKLTNKIKSDKLTGQVLKVQTGRLRNSIKGSVNKNNNIITGSVGTNVKYAAAHEYGFHGTVSVKTHLRKITQAFGNQISPTSVMVQSHSRKMNFPERSFLRSALMEMRNEIISDLNSAIGSKL